jgi:hypothetical protein
VPGLTSGNTALRSMQRCGSGRHRLTRDDTGVSRVLLPKSYCLGG